MYTRIDLTGLGGSARTRAIELRIAVDAANTAHAATPPGSPQHIIIDRTLQSQIVHIESLIKGSTYTNSPELRAQLTRARDELRNHLTAAGQSPQPTGEPQTTLSQRIAELPDAAAEELANVLAIYKANPGLLAANLPHIFPGGSDPVAVARWTNFLNTHTITFLGGANIINFRVTANPPLLDPPEVLKLEYRFGFPSRMDTVLRTAVPGLCTPSAASRLVLAPNKTLTSYIGRSLMVTTLCANGGAGGYAKRGRQEYIVAAVVETAATLTAAGRIPADIDAAVAAKIHDLTNGMSVEEINVITLAATTAANAARIAVTAAPLTAPTYTTAASVAAKALNQRIQGIASQMCARLQDLEGAGIYFPDAKLDNWVVEGDGTLHVADTKSFKRSPPHVIDETHADNEGIEGRIRTNGYNLMDIDANVAPSIIHRAILGRNIYYALTGVRPDDTTRPRCDEVVFQGEIGTKYKDLIRGLTRRTGLAPPGTPDPNITLAQAARTLREIEIMQAPSYALAGITQKALMVALATNPGYEAANPAQRALMAELAASPDYEAASPTRRALVAALATNPIYEAANPIQRALMAALAVSPSYEAANPAQKELMAALAAKPIYEAAIPATRQRMLEAMLTPAYAAIVAKIHDLEALTGQDHTTCLLSSLHAACGGVDYDRDTALAAIRETANRAYDTMVEANALRATVTAPVQPTLGGQPLLTDILLNSDKVASIGVPADLGALVTGLETHRTHLGAARDRLPELRSLQGLIDACNGKRFGVGDVVMDQFLARARQDVLDGATLDTRLANAHRIHGELTVTRAGLNDPVNQSVHDNITRLRGKKYSHGAGAKATAIESAAAVIPIASRISIRTHVEDADVRNLFGEMSRSRSLFGGLGAASATPLKIESYKLAMRALRPPEPSRDELDEGSRDAPHH
ncbi:hypothetical protein [Legionella maioricensis]|uniref:Uncharacterized protein n=1 Tax=Legionella maioricensis TaxID=2896528 RepID=A0A9X2ICY8_9GAMM|nr:hypothetical protein [Legionella maioricensis]MCL9685686.1 hypothetical protein [Legionella maioricensis]MCL9689092.1 hypothetical protein [Legionella maioricensis]